MLNIFRPVVLVILASSTCLSITLLPESAVAQSSAQDVAEIFAQRMADGVKEPPIPLAESTQVNGQLLSGGYYRFVVKPVDGSAIVADLDCKENLKAQVGAKHLADMLTGNTRDVGVALELPLNSSNGTEAKAELNLFRLTKAGKTCKVEQSLFSLRSVNEPFTTPFMPLALNPNFAGDKRSIKFRPWSAQTAEPERMSALWKGIGAFAKLLGPIGSFASTLIGDKEDPYALRAPLGASFFNATKIDPNFGGEIRESSQANINFVRSIRIMPAKSTEFTNNMNRITANWSFINKNKIPVKIGYDIDVDFIASRITTEKNFQPINNNNLLKLIEQNSGISEKAWEKITPAIENLGNQIDPKTFSAACTPAIQDLVALNLSKPDQSLLIYAIARAKRKFKSDELNEITCLRGNEIDSALLKFTIKIERPNFNDPADAARSAEVLAKAFRNPGSLGGGNPSTRLSSVIKGDVNFTVAESLILNDGQKFGIGSLSKEQFLTRFKQIAFLTHTSCILNDWEGGMPPSSGRDSLQKPIALLGRREDGPIFLIVAGLGTTDASDIQAAPPEITSLFVTDAPEPADNVIVDIRQKMQALDVAQCDRVGRFAPFFAPPPVSPQSDMTSSRFVHPFSRRVFR